ncbi:hypothetical protein HPP92_003114 [Vanilla planifolia]|uniref:Uncharacterized protein n=1 Tax=Vanilla planifolia TaxID=51239 RepID=A0A835S6T2_VANPL|nr:hypothetical protein HPP92_003114 [Vanilla planifolia]
MEDFNDTAAGCVVISCCCPCLLLQITLFVFLRLPRSYLQTEWKEISKEVIRDEDDKTLLGDEEVWEELVREGMFWFGSFWREGHEEMLD